jgi:hypothetical protein
MKTYHRASFVFLVALTLLVTGCWKSTESNNPAKPSPDAAFSPHPAVGAPAENLPSQVPPPTGPKKSKAKQVPKTAAPVQQRKAAPKTAQQPPVEPELKAPTVVNTVPFEPVPKPQRVTIPAGTLIPIRMIDSVDSRTSQVGQTYRASIDTDIVIDDQIVVPKESDARLKLTVVSSAGKLSGKSELQLELERIVVSGASYVVASNAVERAAEAEGPKTARDIGIGAAIGAVIGAITGGKKGAAIGAGVGAGSGVAVAEITKGEQVVVPSESRLDFRLEQPVEITLMPRGPTD